MSLVLLVQVWTRPYSDTIILSLKLILSEKNYSKFNIFFTLGFKITKSLPRNPTNLWLSNCTKKFASISLKFSVLILLNFLWQNCSIFLHQVGLSIMKPPWSTLLIEGFPMVPSVWWGHHGLGDFLFEKQNKQYTFLNR